MSMATVSSQGARNDQGNKAAEDESIFAHGLEVMPAPKEEMAATATAATTTTTSYEEVYKVKTPASEQGKWDECLNVVKNDLKMVAQAEMYVPEYENTFIGSNACVPGNICEYGEARCIS